MTEKEQILKKFGAAVKKIRKNKNLTMLDVEVATGISEGCISKIENGKKNPALATVIKLAEGLEVSPSKLLQSFDEPHSSILLAV